METERILIDSVEDGIEVMLTEEGFNVMASDFTPEGFVDNCSRFFPGQGFELVKPEGDDYTGCMLVGDGEHVYSSAPKTFAEALDDIMSEGKISLKAQ